MDDNLPVEKDNFLAEVEVMDLSPIRDHQFMVAIGSGAPEKVKFLCSSIHGPYNFIEMMQEVGEMWVNHQHHAKVIICGKDSTKKVELLHPNTVDYIECHYADLITEELIGGDFFKEFTCKAGTTSELESTDPRHQQKVESTNADEQNPSP